MTESKFTSKKAFIKQFIMHSSHTLLGRLKFETETNGIYSAQSVHHIILFKILHQKAFVTLELVMQHLHQLLSHKTGI